jgi:hypothetical protein
MSERDTFGPRLRCERERRGISLETISTLTNVGVELWEGLERNDFSRWPSGIFARAFIRDYARSVGLDADEIVDEFCRLFPVGDRRTARVIRAQAELIGHDPEYHDEPQLIPGGVERRGTGRPGAGPQAPAARFRIAPRTLAAAFDTVAVGSCAAVMALLTPVSFWPSLGIVALVYYAAGTIATGASPGARVTELLQHRVPTLFAPAAHRRAHA